MGHVTYRSTVEGLEQNTHVVRADDNKKIERMDASESWEREDADGDESPDGDSPSGTPFGQPVWPDGAGPDGDD